jgi:putative ABC transport system permease protein
MVRDLAFGFRLLRRAPGMALTAASTLALGIAATTALVSVVYAVVVNPLPFPESRQLVQMWRSELPALTYGSASFARYLDWRAQQRPFTELGAWAPRGMTIGGSEGPERVSGATASSSYFGVIGQPPIAGRWFTEDEDRRGGPKVTVIGEGLWRRRFGGAASAIGSDIQIDGEVYTVIGVAPASFAEVWRYDIWIPLGLGADPGNRGSNYLLTIGRLRPGVSIDAARAQMGELAAAMSRDHAEDDYTFTLRDVHDVVTQGASRGLWVLLGATILLLLIGCTNVANLMLARSVARERDLAVRASLGASRHRLVSQVLGETLALGVVGSVAGAALAWALLRAFVAVAPPTFPRLSAIAADLRVLAITIGIGVLSGLIAGLLPALNLVRADLTAASHGGATRGTTARRARSAGRLLVVSEMAIALALVTTAGVMVKSLLRLQDVDLGLTREPVLTFAVSLPPFVADGGEAIRRVQTEFLRRVRAIPAVSHASAINMLPVAATGNNGIVQRPDQTGDREGVPVTEVRVVMDGYADAMGMRLLAGRAIDERDHADTAPVAVVNRSLASRLWPTLSASQVVGLQVRSPFDSGNTLREVIGVVADVRSRRPDAPPDPEIHAPFSQVPFPTLTYVVRAEGDPTRLTGPVRAALAEMSPHVALAGVRTFDEVVRTATRTSGLLSWLSVLFGALAGALAVVGIYGLMSYTVAQRERELAVRAAVGASRRSLLTLIMREGLVLSAIGIGLGLAIAWAASGVLGSLLYEVTATDGAVFVLSAVGLAAVACGGYVLPAIRAARVEPVAALRSE